jgi:6-pyruvoyltetrahydropterin/6-carboxytetrahydropterin synthase
MEISRRYGFEAAHRLPNVPEGHKCARLHGHSFRVTIHVEGEVGATTGWVMDFADVDTVAGPIVDQLDHHYLNDIEGLDNPTSERIVEWLWERLEPRLAGLSRITVSETCTSAATKHR